jgi:hypothetical protein
VRIDVTSFISIEASFSIVTGFFFAEGKLI